MDATKNETKKPLVVFDCETTGLDAHSDWIIQLSAIKLNKDTFETIEEFSEYCIPPKSDFEISVAAETVHNLSKEFILENGKPLKEVGEKFLEFIEGCDMAGYNSNTFDVKFIYYNFAVVGLKLPMNRIFYDVMLMETHLNPRHLVDVYKRYTGMDMEELGLRAHDALSDVRATAQVMRLQMGFNKLNWEDIEEWNENRLCSPEGSLRWGGPNLIVMAMGKYRDVDLYTVFKKDPSYLKWWSGNVASEYSLHLGRSYLKMRQKMEEEENAKVE